MEVMQISLLLLLAAIQLHVTLAADRISGKRDHSSGKDPVSARDIRLECCKQKWTYCCKQYSWNISTEDRATNPPLPRSEKNPKCTLAKARREKSQALQGITMVDILIAMHAEYHTIRELELCVPTVNSAKRDELIRRIMIRRDFLEISTVTCSAVHVVVNNHTAGVDEIVERFHNFTALKQQLRHINRYCPHHGHSETIKRLFSEALHRLGQQLKGLECLESLSRKSDFCLDKCIREKSVQKCINQWL